MTPSPQQQAICDAVGASTANLVVEAAPGSGKTTTIGMAARTLPLGKLYVALAFAKANADDFQRKLPLHVMASTCHSLAKRAIDASANGAAPRVVADKVKFILKDSFDLPWAITPSVIKLVSLMKQQPETLSPDEVSDLADAFNIDTEDSRVIPTAERALAASDADRSRMDFDDMLRFAALDPNVRFPAYGIVFVDEAQDTNAVQRVLLEKLRCRIVAVGDPRQSIYGFRGADHNAMDALRDMLSATVLPLSVSYRCSRAVVREAQRVLASPRFTK